MIAYLATPYTNFPGGIEPAFIAAAKLVAALLKTGVKVYSPIAHTHPVAIYGDIDPLDHAIWIPFDQGMMDVCGSLIVAQLPTWERSRGVAMEIDYFRNAGKPIFDLNPETLFMVRRR